MLSIHKIYLLKKFTKKIFIVSGVFFVLVLIVNLIEEINYLKNANTTILTPIFLTFLNAPSLLYQMFPFIFLISTQFFFIEIIDSKEINTLKYFGLDNFNVLKFLSITSFIYGLFIILIFYNFSSVLKNQYLKIKNNYANDNKYLAAITKNGIWIKDTSKNNYVIINADQLLGNYLTNASITEFNDNFEIKKNIIAEKVNVKNFNWILNNSVITDQNNFSKFEEKSFFKSNFNKDIITNSFSDLSSLTFFQLEKLKKDYEKIGYSLDEITIQKQKFYSLPFLLMIMTIISTIIMVNNKFKKNIFINLLVGIFFSVVIYYISHFSSLLGENGRLPLKLSVWFPVIVLFILSSISIVTINEK